MNNDNAEVVADKPALPVSPAGVRVTEAGGTAPAVLPMPAELAIQAQALSKCYNLYDQPSDRLRQLLWGRSGEHGRRYYREFWALRESSFAVARGEVMGLVGRNGAGKSTLLQLVCGTLAPTGGTLAVRGRIAALLELGAGFNPEFTGRENVFMAASIMGLSTAEIEARFEEIVNFSGLRDFIEQPVKTYSSGMYVRLAFSVATSVDPDILVIDEALSVGDGEFARKSFDRIMEFRARGVTILFCSHALYQVQALCDRVIWLADGEVRALGKPQAVLAEYDAYLGALATAPARTATPAAVAAAPEASAAPSGTARLRGAEVSVDGKAGQILTAVTDEATVRVKVAFDSDAGMPAPTVAVCFVGPSGQIATSVSTFFDQRVIARSAGGKGVVAVEFPALPLLKGRYSVDIYLMCEKGVFVYDSAVRAAELTVEQHCLTQGVMKIPHVWHADDPA